MFDDLILKELCFVKCELVNMCYVCLFNKKMISEIVGVFLFIIIKYGDFFIIYK